MKNTLFLCLAVVTLLLLSGCGSRDAGTEQTATPQEKLISAARAYLITQPQISGESCHLGTAMSVFRLTESGLENIDYQLFPVYAGDAVVALATGTTNEKGEYTTGCGADFAPALQNCLSEAPDAAFAVVYAADGPYFLRESGEPVSLNTHPVPGCAAIETLASYREQLSYASIQKDVAFSPPQLPPAA